MQKKWMKQSAFALVSTAVFLSQPIFTSATVNDLTIAAATSNAVAKAAATKTIEDVKNGTIKIAGKTYKVTKSLRAFASVSNKAALKGAEITFTLNGKKEISDITFLELKASGKKENKGAAKGSKNVVLNGKGMTISGNLKVTGDYVTVKSVKVKGNATIAPNKGNVAFFNDVAVSGTTTIASKSGSISDAKELAVYFQKSSLKQVINNNKNAKISFSMKTKVTKLTMNDKGMVSSTSTVTIPSVEVNSDVASLTLDTPKLTNLSLFSTNEVVITATKNTVINHILTHSDVVVAGSSKVLIKKLTLNSGSKQATMNLPIKEIVVNTNASVELLGAASLPKVTLKGASQAKIAVKGSIGTFTVEGNDAKITSLKTVINNLIIPDDLKVKDVVSNLSSVSTYIKKVNGKAFSYKNIDLTLLHTNDTHASLSNIARRATAIQEERENIENVLLVDAGDVFSGTLYFTKFEGLADAEFMNILGYDAMTFGNHEFDKDSRILANFVGALEFPLLTSNIDFSEDQYLGKFVTDDYINESNGATIAPALIKEIDGQKVGIIGLTTKDTEVLASPGPTVKFNEVISSAKRAVEGLEEAGINKIIALTHIGYEADLQLAEAVGEIDVIVGGHSHTRLDEPVVIETKETKTLIVQAEDQSKYLGKLEVEFNPEGEMVDYEGSLLNLNATNADGSNVYAENEEIAKKLAGYTKEIDELQKEIVGFTNVALEGARANVRTKETNLGNLITDAMLAEAKKTVPQTTIAFQNGGGIRAGIDQGEISLGEVLTVMPFANMLVTLELTYEEILGALENSVEHFPAVEGKFLHVSGLHYEYDLSLPPGSRIVNIEVLEDGRYVPIDKKKTYFVATNAYIAGGGDFFDTLKQAKEAGRIIEQYVVDYDVFVNYLTKNPSVNPDIEGRIVEHIEATAASGTEDTLKTYSNNILVNVTDADSLSYMNVTGILYIKGNSDVTLNNVHAKEIIYID